MGCCKGLKDENSSHNSKYYQQKNWYLVCTEESRHFKLMNAYRESMLCMLRLNKSTIIL